jgi:hypothetical protein
MVDIEVRVDTDAVQVHTQAQAQAQGLCEPLTCRRAPPLPQCRDAQAPAALPGPPLQQSAALQAPGRHRQLPGGVLWPAAWLLGCGVTACWPAAQPAQHEAAERDTAQHGTRGFFTRVQDGFCSFTLVRSALCSELSTMHIC